jgi:hypothetical protein
VAMSTGGVKLLVCVSVRLRCKSPFSSMYEFSTRGRPFGP